MKRDKVVRPERRELTRRSNRLGNLSEVVHESPWSERRVHCWDLDPDCTEERRRRCSAHFVERNCWDLWATEYFPVGRKPCCHSLEDCSECALPAAKFGDTLPVYVEVPATSTRRPAAQGSNDKAHVYCTHLYSVSREPLIVRSDDEDRLDFRCQRRRGIVLHSTYVSDVCGTHDHKECIFYESD